MFGKENKLKRTHLVKKKRKEKKEKIDSNRCVILLANYGFISVDGDIDISFDI